MPWPVSLVPCPGYDPVLIRAALVDVLAPFGGMPALCSPGDQVLLKPNLLCARSPEEAVTTHPAVVAAALREVRGAGGVADIGDSPGGFPPPSREKLFDRTGMSHLAREETCSITLFDTPVPLRSPPSVRYFREFPVASQLPGASLLVNLPKLKTHHLTGMTGAVKNLFGLIPGTAKTAYHLQAGRDSRRFASLLLDLHEAVITTVPRVIHIMDAVVAMEGRGPSHGSPRNVDVLLASPSAPALDYLAAELMGIDPLSIPTIAGAVERGIGPSDRSEVRYSGPDISTLSIPPFRMPGDMGSTRLAGPLLDLASFLSGPRPVLDLASCHRCGICAGSCPAGALTGRKGEVPQVRAHRCIRCYCCEELCPADAVRVRSRWPFNG